MAQKKSFKNYIPRIVLLLIVIGAIIYAYQKWGVNCLTKFRGMFAFGIVDANKKEIFLARDHFGIKPQIVIKCSSINFRIKVWNFFKLLQFTSKSN